MESLEKFFMHILGQGNEELAAKAAEASTIVQYEKGAVLIQQGEIPRNMFFLVNGLARGVTQGDKGQELTLCFVHIPGQCIMPNADLHAPASCAMEAIAPCKAIRLPIASLEQLMDKNPQALLAYVSYVRRECDNHIELNNALGQYDAHGRYLWFCKKYPDLLGIVPDKQIASYLNMTPVTLSRVRHKIREKRLEHPDIV
ncbi:MAG: Crp/Fnr family transcriptional regulator [Gemmiger sp.]|nr:Crp/Fnr family transcriptional regulator [Gemmiger sp.]